MRVPVGLVAGTLVGVVVSALSIPRLQGDAVVVTRGAAGDGGAASADASALDLADPAAAPTSAPAGSTRTTARVGASTGTGTEAGQRAGAASGSQVAAPGAKARGVTATSVRVGAGILDIGAVRSLGPAFDNGDGEQHMRAFLAGIKRDGLVPIHGRDVEFTYRRYGVISPEEQRAACSGFVEDDQVFAVLAGSNFQLGAECVAAEYRTPLITSDALDDTVFQRSHPYLFTFQMSTSRLFRNWVHWAHRRGLLKGKDIGLYYPGSAESEDLVNRTIKAELARLGYKLAAEFTTANNLGGPEDALAVQRFKSAGVDIAMLLASRAGFMQQAQAQDYHPDYLDSDFASGTTNTASSTYPPQQFDGAMAMSGMRYGEWKAGLPDPARAAKCAEYYQRHSGARIDPNAREAEWIGMNKLCDTGWALLEALRLAGRDLTPARFVAALEQVRGLALGIHPDVSFSSAKHHGVELQRTLQWAAGCSCWRAISPLEPLLVP